MKKLAILCLLFSLAVSCSTDSARREKADALLSQARTLLADRAYDSALVVLDTLDISYRDCLEQRRIGTSLRLETLAALSRDSLAAAEARLRGVTAEIESLAPGFRKVEIPGTAGYTVDKDVYSGTEMNTSGIQARIDEDGYCFVIANVASRRIGLRSIRVGDVVTPAGHSIEVEGSEIMSVNQENAAALLELLSSGTDKINVELVGSRGKVAVTLTPRQRRAIADTWRYARALQQKRTLDIRLEKLERQIARLSDQLAARIELPEED